MTLSNDDLEEFWATYIHPKMFTSSLNQCFVRGKYGGFSIRELMEICIQKLGKTRPIIESDNCN